MRFSHNPVRSDATVFAAVLLLGGCELALHEVQQVTTDGCQPWQEGCPAPVGPVRGTVPPARMDPTRAEIVTAATDAPYRPCDTLGLLCQGRIIGDVLWDQYVMVLAGRPHSSATAASAGRAVPSHEALPAPRMTAPAPAATVPGRIVRTHGTRAGESAPLLPRAPSR